MVLSFRARKWGERNFLRFILSSIFLQCKARINYCQLKIWRFCSLVSITLLYLNIHYLNKQTRNSTKCTKNWFLFLQYSILVALVQIRHLAEQMKFILYLFSHSIHVLQLYSISKLIIKRETSITGTAKICLILENDSSSSHILFWYLAPCPYVARGIGPAATFRFISVCPLGSHLNLYLVNHPLRDREPFQGIHMYTRVVPVRK